MRPFLGCLFVRSFRLPILAAVSFAISSFIFGCSGDCFEVCSCGLDFFFFLDFWRSCVHSLSAGYFARLQRFLFFFFFLLLSGIQIAAGPFSDRVLYPFSTRSFLPWLIFRIIFPRFSCKRTLRSVPAWMRICPLICFLFLDVLCFLLLFPALVDRALVLFFITSFLPWFR